MNFREWTLSWHNTGINATLQQQESIGHCFCEFGGSVGDEYKLIFEQENLTQHGISIPPQSCLQCRRRAVTSRVIDPPRAIYNRVLVSLCLFRSSAG